MTSAALTEAPPRVPRVVYVLGAGVFAVGTSEFMIAGLLPELARDLDVSISATGLLVSAFAIGMLAGAPVMAVLTLRLPHRATLVAALLAVAAAHVLGAVAQTYGVLMLSRVLAAVATGAFWAVAAVVCVSATPPALRSRSMAALIGGLTVANVVGVPAGTQHGQHLGWRAAFWAVAVLAVVAIAGVLSSVPAGRGEVAPTSVRREVRTFRQGRLWLALLTTATFQAGVMCTITYLGPLLIDVAGVREGLVPLLFTALGVGSVVGTVLSGRFGDAQPWATLYVAMLGMAAVCAALAVFSAFTLPTAVLTFVLGVTAFGVAGPLNGRIFQLAGDAPTLASASNVSAFNVGNTVGPWLGALTIDAGLGLTSPPWLAVGLSLAALTLGLTSRALDARPSPARAPEPVACPVP